MTFPEVAQELGIKAARSTLEKVMHKHHKIYRRSLRVKPALLLQDKEARVSFASWALEKLDEDPSPLFVFTDESWINLGQSRRRRKKVSRPVRSNPWDYTRPKNKPEVSVMFGVRLCMARSVHSGFGRKSQLWKGRKLMLWWLKNRSRRRRESNNSGKMPILQGRKPLRRWRGSMQSRRNEGHATAAYFHRKAPIKSSRQGRSYEASEMPEELTGSNAGNQYCILSSIPGSCNSVVRTPSVRSG